MCKPSELGWGSSCQDRHNPAGKPGLPWLVWGPLCSSAGHNVRQPDSSNTHLKSRCHTDESKRKSWNQFRPIFGVSQSQLRRVYHRLRMVIFSQGSDRHVILEKDDIQVLDTADRDRSSRNGSLAWRNLVWCSVSQHCVKIGRQGQNRAVITRLPCQWLTVSRFEHWSIACFNLQSRVCGEVSLTLIDPL